MASKRKISYDSSPTRSVSRLPKLFADTVVASWSRHFFQASCPSGTAGASLRLPLQDHSRAGTALPVMRGTTGTTCVDDPDSARGAAEPAVPRWMVDRRE